MKPIFILPHRALYGLLAALLCLLAACGQKGPLYLPTKPAPATPAPAQVPTTTTTVTTTTTISVPSTTTR